MRSTYINLSLALVVLVINLSPLFSQCPPGTELEFLTQTKLDEFKTLYPNCTEYNGDIEVICESTSSSSDPIVNLEALSNLEIINGKLLVRSQYLVYSELSSLNGLQNLRKVKDLYIQKFNHIESLNELANLDSLETFRITNLPRLKSISSLSFYIKSDLILEQNDELESLGDFDFGDNSLLKIRLSNNPQLFDFGSLVNLTAVGLLSIKNLGNYDFVNNFQFIKDLRVNGSDNLTDLSDFKSLQFVNSYDLNDLPDFRSLSQLANIPDWKLDIENCPLINLEGLNDRNDNLVVVLEDLSELNDISNLENFPILNGLEIISCPQIKDLGSLKNLTEIFGYFALVDLPIVNLNGLENLEELPWLELTSNLELIDIFALSNIRSFMHFMEIVDNRKLDNCSIIPICQSLENATYSIYGNGLNCAEEEDVLKYCGVANVVKVFYDKNINGVHDQGESGLSIGHFKDDEGRLIFPNDEGFANIFVDNTARNIEYISSTAWKVNTNNAMLRFEDNLSSDTAFVGIKALVDTSKYNISIISSHIVCDQDFYYDILIKNKGTTIETINLNLTGFGTFISSNASYTQENEIIKVVNENLAPGSIESIRLYYQAPGVEDFDIGDRIRHRLDYTTVADDQTVTSEKTIQMFDTYFCSYDPNDKQVYPRSEDGTNKVALDQDQFTYTIRFQNTGNYRAQNLMIADTLSEFLDPSTFSFLGSSHKVTNIEIDKSNLSFEFNNIFLPDSTSNLEDSQGYVTFSIAPYPNMEDGTQIKNTANIYFDSNPVVVTNTVVNTFEDLISSTDKINISNPFVIFPNPAKDYFAVKNLKDLKHKDWTIYNTKGEICKSGKIKNSDSIDIVNLESGIYIFSVESKSIRFVKI